MMKVCHLTLKLIIIIITTTTTTIINIYFIPRYFSHNGVQMRTDVITNKRNTDMTVLDYTA